MSVHPGRTLRGRSLSASSIEEQRLMPLKRDFAEAQRIDQSNILGSLYIRHADWLARVIRRSGPSEAQDVVQEVFLRLARHPTGTLTHPRALLLAIARNVLCSHARKERAQKRNAPDPLAESVVRTLQGPQIETLLLREAILSLPPLCRDVFVLNKFDGMTYAEIAVARGITVKVVEYRMAKALTILRRALA